MAYAMIGVPLMLMCLSNLGRVLAESVRQTYARLCIRQSEHHKCPTEDIDDQDTYNGHTYQSADEKNEVNGFAFFFFFFFFFLCVCAKH